jgi:hypothetical protein
VAEAGVDLQAEWKVQFQDLQQQIRNRSWFKKVAEQTFNRHSLILETDRTPVDVVLRRTAALLADLAPHIESDRHGAFEAELAKLRTLVDASAAEESAGLFAKVCELRRRIVFANPLLDFDRIAFITCHYTANHCCDQYFGFNAKPGGGLYVLSKPFSDSPELTDVLADSTVEGGRLEGQKLKGGSFRSLSLSYDADTFYFAYTQCGRSKERWSPERSWHVFKVRVDGTGLQQLTDGKWNEFDPCELPNGRLVFISERRGGFGRCHPRPVPTYTLHSMRTDGSDIVALSFHETNEWNPSVNHNGMIVYTRWDYVDRGDCIAHHPWITYPDGRDPRAIHGNFPSNRNARPDMEMHVRAIPGSHRYISTAAGHHRQAYGSLVVIDPRIEDDGAMSPAKRLTPDMQFPETERGGHAYGTAWPLSETYYLCCYAPMGKGRQGLYVVDAFGNKELLYRDSSINSIHPVPLRPYPRPPVLLHNTAVGAPQGYPVPDSVPTTGTIGCVNVYKSLKPWPKGTKIKALRVIQLFPKATIRIDQPRISIAAESLARGVLGTVPVAEDGSVYFEAPAGKPIYFQALDENGVAVQNMMSATYVHPGERLVCQGCHEPSLSTVPASSKIPMAFLSPPAKLQKDVDGTWPLSFPRLVQPILDKRCVGCHRQNKKGPNLSGESAGRGDWSHAYNALRKYAYGCAGKPPNRQPVRATPGKVGARASKLYPMLMNGHNKLELTPEELRRIGVWLDCNSNFFGAYFETKKQLLGELVVPLLE